MRKLLEAVAPLFERKADPDIVAKFADVRPQDRSYYIMKWAEKKGMDSDEAMELAGYVRDGYMGAGVYNWRYVGMDESVEEEVVVEADITQAIDELSDILGELEQLGEQARNIVRMIDRGEAERLDAYGAFDFGSSSNRYDTTLASFVEELESGQYDNE